MIKQGRTYYISGTFSVFSVPEVNWGIVRREGGGGAAAAAASLSRLWPRANCQVSPSNEYKVLI